MGRSRNRRRQSSAAAHVSISRTRTLRPSPNIKHLWKGPLRGIGQKYAGANVLKRSKTLDSAKSLQRTRSKGRSRSTALSSSFFEPTAHIGDDLQRPRSICERRKRRREVLFANDKAGRSGQRKPRFTAASKVRCK